MEGHALYRRSQMSPPGLLALIFYGPLAVVTAVWYAFGVLREMFPALAALAAVITVVFLAGRRLTVSVTASGLAVEYGLGWPRRQIPRSEIVSAEPFRAPWWYGVGIRFTPKGWLWSIWGFRTVLLTLSNGKHFLIGTDDPEALAAALR